MARLARIVVPGLPHHVTQRGNRREAIFFEDGDQEIYCDLLAEQSVKAGVEVWAYCLTPNHVHLILVPADPEALGRAVGETHRRYINYINARGRSTGHLFQSRFASVPLDPTHLLRAVRYVSLNPVRARLVSRVKAHLASEDDALATVHPILARVANFKELLQPGPEEDFRDLREAEGTGRPLGTSEFGICRRPRGHSRAQDCATRPGTETCHQRSSDKPTTGTDLRGEYVSCPLLHFHRR